MRVAIHLTSIPHISRPELFRRAVAVGRIAPDALALTDVEGQTILHAVAKSIGGAKNDQCKDTRQDDLHAEKAEAILTGTSYIACPDCLRRTKQISGWRTLAKELMGEVRDLHCISKKSRTPFVDLFAAMFAFIVESDEDPIPVILRSWLEDLTHSGISLKEYGHTEFDLYSQGSVCWNFEGLQTSTNGVRRNVRWYLASFTYGEVPSDWSICITEQTNEHLKEPRHMAQPWELIPGGWVEEDTH